MKKRFTYAEFAVECQKHKGKIKREPIHVLYTYKSRGLVVQDGDTYVISDKFCKKYGIRE